MVSNRVEDIGEPLLWQLVQFLLIWQVFEAFLVFGHELLDFFDRERFVLGNRYVFDILAHDEFLGPRDQIFEKAIEIYRLV